MTTRLAAGICCPNMRDAIDVAAELEARTNYVVNILHEIVEGDQPTVFMEACVDVAGDSASNEQMTKMAREVEAIIEPFRAFFISINQGPTNLHVPLPWREEVEI
jgi:hypothetical protein